MKRAIKLGKQLFRYGLVAAIGLIIDFGSIIIAVEVFELNYLIAITLGFILGLLVTYVLSNQYVFGKSKMSKETELALFTIIGIIGLIILDFIVWIMTGKLGFNYIVSKALATIVVFMWNFFARRSLYHER